MEKKVSSKEEASKEGGAKGGGGAKEEDGNSSGEKEEEDEPHFVIGGKWCKIIPNIGSHDLGSIILCGAWLWPVLVCYNNDYDQGCNYNDKQFVPSNFITYCNKSRPSSI